MDERNFEELLRSALPAGTLVTISFLPKTEIDYLKADQHRSARPGERLKPPCMVSKYWFLRTRGKQPELAHVELLVQEGKRGEAHDDLNRRVVDKNELRSVLLSRGFKVGEGGYVQS